ncbi:protein EURL homolog [Nycticebus coucang]|uniref:protein EURL homolog n=1 Tax=Nycticebus coucang TaxID=9470 RepID=UPI00234CA6C6|nr:protein EURL homolog [Nycticebus coucang]
MKSHISGNGKKLRPRDRRTQANKLQVLRRCRRAGVRHAAAVHVRSFALGRVTVPTTFLGWRRQERAGPGARRPPLLQPHLLRPETIVEKPEPGGSTVAASGAGRGTMNEEEQFVNIDLNDDNICSVCKLGTDKETLSFCHICFELNIEGIPKSNLLHTRSLRGHKDCFEKCHLIANQDCPRSKLSKSTYEEVKTILSKKINWIVQYAQNKDLDSDSESSKNSQHQLFNFRHKPDKKLLPQCDSQVPKYSAKWIDGSTGGISNCTQRILQQRENSDFGLNILQDSGAAFCRNSVLWSHSHKEAQKKEETVSSPQAKVQTQHPHYSREELNSMTLGEVEQLSTKLLQQIQEVFEELTQQVQEKDSLASELHVRHVAIEQLLKNYSKLPCLQVGRTGMKSHLPINN